MISEQIKDVQVNTPACTSVEAQLLCLCAAPVKSPQSIEQIRQFVSSNIQWDKFYHLAKAHEMIPLIYQALVSLCPEKFDAKQLNKLTAQFHANTRHNLMLTAELIRLLKLFESHNIPALIYKGPALAMQAYGTLTSRQFCDLDLLVHKSDLDKIIGMLSAEGYFSQESTLNILQDKWFRLNNCEYHFQKKPENIYVEIHWRFFENHIRFPINLQEVWQHTQNISINTHQVRSLSPEHMLLILCIHGGGKHHWSNLKMIADIAALIHRQKHLNWEMIQQNVDKLGIRRLFFTGLLLSKNLLDAPIPESIQKEAQKDLQAVLLYQKVTDCLFNTINEKTGISPKGVDKSLFYIQSREKGADKLLHFWHFIRDVFTPTDKEAQLVSLPSGLAFLHRVIRPVRLVVKYSIFYLKSRRQTNHSAK